MLNNLSIVAQLSGDLDEADRLAAQAQETFEALGLDYGVMVQLHNRGLIALHAREFERARGLLERAAAEAERLGSDVSYGNSMCDLGILALSEGRTEDAVPFFCEALASALRSGWRINVAYALRGLSSVLAARGELTAAARVLGAALTVQEETGEVLQGYAVTPFEAASAPVRASLDDPEIAAAYAAGTAMRYDDAAAYALGAVAESAPH